MARCLFSVQDSCLIQGRGLVLAPGIIVEGSERFQSGDPIALIKPDGSVINTHIDALEVFSPNPRGEVLIMLKGKTKEDVPVGTKVWSI
jgi:hypothetical protein